jgi:hypothetical protein
MCKVFFSILLCSSFILSAQQQLVVVDSAREFSKGLYNSYQVFIPETKVKDIQRDWLAYLKPLSKDKILMINGEIIASNAVCSNITASPICISSKLLETDKAVRLTVWFAEDSGRYVSQTFNADHHTAAAKFVHDFAVQEYQKVVMVQLNNSKKVEAILENRLKSQVKAEDRSTTKISQNERYIQRNTTDIPHNESLQKIKTDAIDRQKQIMQEDTTTNPDILKAYRKRLNGLQSDFNKLRNQAEKLHRQIDNWTQGIKDAQRTIEQAKKSQEGLVAQIETQKGIVQGFQNKYDAIK